jgi:hypothetical protein
LSWAAKIGIEASDRRVLGNHVPKTDSSLMAYARDSISAPLLKLEHAYGKIRAGIFRPDADRSGRWVSEPDGQLQSMPFKVMGAEDPEPEEFCDDSEHEGEYSDHDDEHDRHVQVMEDVVRDAAGAQLLLASRAAALGGSDILYRHSGSLVVHRAREGDEAVMACGRRSKFYDRVLAANLVVMLKCRACFGTRQDDNVDE